VGNPVGSGQAGGYLSDPREGGGVATAVGRARSHRKGTIRSRGPVVDGTEFYGGSVADPPLESQGEDEWDTHLVH